LYGLPIVCVALPLVFPSHTLLLPLFFFYLRSYYYQNLHYAVEGMRTLDLIELMDLVDLMSAMTFYLYI
jgi:hypothetical protein